MTASVLSSYFSVIRHSSLILCDVYVFFSESAAHHFNLILRDIKVNITQYQIKIVSTTLTL